MHDLSHDMTYVLKGLLHLAGAKGSQVAAPSGAGAVALAGRQRRKVRAAAGDLLPVVLNHRQRLLLQALVSACSDRMSAGGSRLLYEGPCMRIMFTSSAACCRHLAHLHAGNCVRVL